MGRPPQTAVEGRSTCCGPNGCAGGVQDVPVDGFGPWPPLFGAGRARLDYSVHVLHQLQLLPAQVLLLDELPASLLLLLLYAVLLSFLSGESR